MLFDPVSDDVTQMQDAVEDHMGFLAPPKRK